MGGKCPVQLVEADVIYWWRTVFLQPHGEPWRYRTVSRTPSSCSLHTRIRIKSICLTNRQMFWWPPTLRLTPVKYSMSSCAVWVKGFCILIRTVSCLYIKRPGTYDIPIINDRLGCCADEVPDGKIVEYVGDAITQCKVKGITLDHNTSSIGGRYTTKNTWKGVVYYQFWRCISPLGRWIKKVPVK